MFGRIKIDKADAMFSRYIRLRDGKCMKCGRLGEENAEGERINGLEASHYFGRANESTRFDEENVIALCAGCHQYWGSTDREDYRDFMIRRLGKKRFELLRFRSNQYKKKDRKLDLIIAKKLLEDFKNEKETNR